MARKGVVHLLVNANEVFNILPPSLLREKLGGERVRRLEMLTERKKYMNKTISDKDDEEEKSKE